MMTMTATKRALAAADARTCFLLEKCPPEIRNVIYEYALTGERGEMILRSSGHDCKLGRQYRKRDGCHHAAPPLDPHHSKQPKKTTFRDVDQLFALSYTCRKIHNECAALPYQYNKVRFVLDIEDIRSNSPPHRELRRIAKRQSERDELKQGLVIDVGCIEGGPHVRLNPFHTFMQKTQRELRSLHKGTKSLGLAFDIGGSELQWINCHRRESYKLVPCGIELCDPESVGVQFTQQLASEMSYIGNSGAVRSATARVIRIFWPVYAVRNGVQ